MQTQTAPERALVEPNIRAFANALDALKREVEADLGDPDRRHIQRIRKLSRALEFSGRGLLHISIEPLTFAAGVFALSLHKCLELMEIGHMALHGAYEGLCPEDPMLAEQFVWKAPIDEACWRREHNVRHHQYTNIAGRDPDVDFGQMRLVPSIAFKPAHRFQPITNLLTWFGFATAINIHITGVLAPAGMCHDPPRARSGEPRTPRRAFFAKAARYYAKEFVFYPLLAGPFFGKVALGNLLSDVARDLCAGSIIYCGHVGAADYPEGTRAGSRARWYVMQAESASNVELPRALSILCGGLDKQIEHHLFPRLPPNRLRQIAPRVRALCARYGVAYRSAPWLESVVGVLRNLFAMSRAPAVA
ncbi:MAG TPA: acyl-CoA desaturase [Polyangiales bacterium]